jgi:hypothetical protein
MKDAASKKFLLHAHREHPLERKQDGILDGVEGEDEERLRSEEYLQSQFSDDVLMHCGRRALNTWPANSAFLEDSSSVALPSPVERPPNTVQNCARATTKAARTT